MNQNVQGQTPPMVESMGGFDDQITFFSQNKKKLGPVFAFPMGAGSGMLIANITGAKTVLVTDSEHYPKGALWQAVGRITGNGLSTNQNEESWKKQRQLMNPAFGRPAVKRYLEEMDKLVINELASWAGTINVTEQSARMSQILIMNTLFGSALNDEEQHTVYEALVTALGEIARLQSIGDPNAPISDEAQGAIDAIDEIIHKLIEQYKSSSGSGQDEHPHLMGHLIHTIDDPQQLRDELMVSFLAGYETTGLTLNWLFWLLAEHLEVQDEIREQLNEEYTLLMAAVDEAMRLFPPVPYIPRQRDATQGILDGFYVDPHTVILVSAYDLHRDSAIWGNDSNSFNPHRWASKTTQQHEAFIPFSIGKRRCIGEHLSREEMRIVLTHILKNFRVFPAGSTPKPISVFTLRPIEDIMLKFERI